MRHAKSDYPAGVDDHDRPLNRRGRLASALMGAWVAEAGAPDLAYVSSAARAAETWARMRLDAPMETRKALYHADAETMLEVARQAPDTAATLLVLWHQPGIGDAANLLLGARLVPAFPTAQIVVIDVEVATWREIVFGEGALIDIAAPKDLV